MRSSVRLIAFLLLTIAVQASAGNHIYRYKDDSGTLHFTTEFHSIPEQYRSQVGPPAPEASTAVERPKTEAAVRIVTASGDYRTGDHDTRLDATRMATEAAKRQALEQVATYLESVTEVKNLDVTRDEIRTYTAGIVTVLNQRTSTHLENGGIVMHVEVTAQVDEDEVIVAINALRENESATRELASLRTETEQLRHQLEAANQALATANTAEQVQALTLQRQQLLNQMQADALVVQALSGYAYLTPSKVRQINELLQQARQLHPSNPHVAAAEQSTRGLGDGLSATAQAPSSSSQLSGPFTPSSQPGPAVSLPPSPLATPPESPFATPLPQSPFATPPQSAFATPLPQSPFATPPQSAFATPLPQPPLAPLPQSPLAAPLGHSPLATPLR